VIQASYAPLVKVYEKPQKAQRAMISQGAEANATSIHARPVPMNPMISERRRPYMSATTPVGISNRKTAASIAVPISTSCSGERWRSLTR
jgi:hypothetical protein